MTSHTGVSFQQPQEGSALTIVMPRGYNQPNGFLNQTDVQDVIRGISLVNQPARRIDDNQQTSVKIPISSTAGIPTKDSHFMDTMMANNVENTDGMVSSQKLTTSQFSGTIEQPFSFGNFVASTGDVQMSEADSMAMTPGSRDVASGHLGSASLISTDQSGMDLVSSLLGSCGQMATLNTQQGQVFNVVILGDPQSNTTQAMSTGILSSGGGVTTVPSAPPSSSIPTIPPGTLLLAVAPTPVNNNLQTVSNTSGAPGIGVETLNNSLDNVTEIPPSSTSDDSIQGPFPSTVKTVRLPAEKKKELKDKSDDSKREKRFSCDVCDKSYYTSSHLKAHKRSHTGERPYVCDICGNCYHRPETLSAHRRIHLGIKRFECEICGKKYGYYSHLNVHIKRVHKKLRPYACETCGKAFTMKNNLRYHQKIHLDEKPHKCMECGRAFTYPTDLSRHMRGHTGEKKYTCDVCNKAFSESGTLTRHKRKVHSGLTEPGEVIEKPKDIETAEEGGPATYECTECDKSFLQEQHLNFHKRTHHETKEKTVKCSYCPRLFETLRCARAHENRMHLLSRTPKEKYECDICEELCMTKKKLAEHKSAHYKLDDESDYTNISSCRQENGYYKCNLCQREFAFPAGLIVHRFSHSNVRPYTCQECGQSFKLRRYLVSHHGRCRSNPQVKDERQSSEVGDTADTFSATDNMIADKSQLGSSTEMPTLTTSDTSTGSRKAIAGNRVKSCSTTSKCGSLSKAAKSEQDPVNVDSLLEQTLETNLTTMGDDVPSSGLVHVIILANKNCDEMGNILPSEAPLSTLRTVEVVPGSTVVSPSTQASPIVSMQAEHDVSVIIPGNDDDNQTRQPVSTTPIAVGQPLTVGESRIVNQQPIAHAAMQEPLDSNRVVVESPSEVVDTTDNLKVEYNELVPYTKSKIGEGCIVENNQETLNDISNTDDDAIPSCQLDNERVVVYLSF